MRTLERAGANAIRLEDQVAPKKCGHFAGKDVIEERENGRQDQASARYRHLRRAERGDVGPLA
ncbi:hypothetical protein [Bradyrhizobium arachidis]|uniref:hypothetical protein n=1 Tax=Bradyrhizobium arachidis TaxID=858423 RepID=UPI00322153B7